MEKRLALRVGLVMVLAGALCLAARFHGAKDRRQAGGQRPPPGVFDLARLSGDERETVALALLASPGVLVTALVRNVVGLQTFGTFAPALIGLSFACSGWRAGAVAFAAVMGSELVGRKLLGNLKLLMVPYLGVVMTLAAVSLAAAVCVMHSLGWKLEARSLLMPAAVLCMVMERFHVRAEEDGSWQAAKVLATTLAAAFCCVTIMRWQAAGALALSYPETQFFVAAALVMTGRYSGYRLSEMLRFRDIVRAEKR